MTASTVEYDNLYSESWNNIYQMLLAQLDDPSDPSGNRKFIYVRNPDVKSLTFKDYPYVVVPPVEVTFGDKESLNRKSSMVNFNMEIEVVTADRAYGSRDAKGAVDNDTISDQLVEILNDATNRKTLSSNGLNFIRPNSTPATPETENNTLVFRRSFILSFSSRKRISA